MEAEYNRRNASLKKPDPDKDKVPYKYLKDCLNTREICIIERIEEQDTLWCYQCGDSSSTGSCITDTAGMEAEYIEFNKTDHTKQDQTTSEGTKTKQYQYLKNCENYDRCVIERIEEQGLLHAYIRDCHNSANNYSFYDPKFLDLDPARNHTSCIYDAFSKRVACVTVCETDFCNGPQIAGGNNSRAQTLFPGLEKEEMECPITINRQPDTRGGNGIPNHYIPPTEEKWGMEYPITIYRPPKKNGEWNTQ
ncbi:unnamed protein product [Mytilus coruscus]|uniref:Uncharacterized protein n=1 Tax=Mytilus coruscus TaxID=42192 RepID=A0A6J8CV74_MYTCO|nr:unnamed protein product [Mytilus coruscus]